MALTMAEDGPKVVHGIICSLGLDAPVWPARCDPLFILDTMKLWCVDAATGKNS